MFEGIDHGMRPLIEAMNTVSYIETYSCCEGHPEEAAVKQYGYAVANVVLEIKHEYNCYPRFETPRFTAVINSSV